MCWQQFQVVRGNFTRLFLRIGYHKISEIPAGARNISIQETKKSRNYLGTHTHTHAHNDTRTRRTFFFKTSNVSLQLCWPKLGYPSSMETGWLTGQEYSQLWEHSWCIYGLMKSAPVVESPSLPLGRWPKTCISTWGNSVFPVSWTVSSTPVPLSHSWSISSQGSVCTMNTSCPYRIHTPVLSQPFHLICHHRVSAPTIMHNYILFKAHHAVIVPRASNPQFCLNTVQTQNLFWSNS